MAWYVWRAGKGDRAAEDPVTVYAAHAEPRTPERFAENEKDSPLAERKNYTANPSTNALILLQLSPDHERAVPVRLRAQLLHAAEALEPLWTPALREHDVDLEAVADLRLVGEGRLGLVRVGDGGEGGRETQKAETSELRMG